MLDTKDIHIDFYSKNYKFWHREWFGVPMLKFFSDIMSYQEIIYKTKPDIIIECGILRGGTTLFLAHMLDLLNNGLVIGIDVNINNCFDIVKQHNRVKLYEGSSVDKNIFNKVKDISKNKKTMVILDSAHHKSHVLDELNLYQDLVSSGCYMICEDSIVDFFEIWEKCSGPYAAIEEFMKNNSSWIDDRSRELYLTANPHGYLLKK